MNARITANLVFGCALNAMAAGCTVHTYSTRPEYPSTAFTSHEHVRHEVAFHTERRDRDEDRERGAYRPDHYRPAHADVRTRAERERAANVRETRDRATSGRSSSTNKPTTNEASTNKPTTNKPSKPARSDAAAEKPQRSKTNEEHVELMPAKPEKAKPARKRILSFQERMELLEAKTHEEVAQKERERRARMSRVLEASRAD